VLAEGHVHIDYAYCSTGGRAGRTTAVLKVSNTEKARRLVGEVAGRGPAARQERRPARDHRIYQPRR
jgi:hypothetical protein